MNFATPAVLLVLIFLPGVFARSAYLRGRWDSHPFKVGSIVDEVAFGAGISLALHALWITLANLLHHPVDLKVVLSLAFGPATGNNGFDIAIANAVQHSVRVFTYFATLYISSWGVGYTAHCLVRKCKWDLRWKLLRFQHDWYYLLSGERLQFHGSRKTEVSPAIDITMVAVLVEQAGTAHIYRGAVDQFYFDSTGQIDRIVLQYPYRAKLSDIEEIEKKIQELGDGSAPQQSSVDAPNLNDAFHEIEGRFMILFTRDVKNINIRYIELKKK